MRKHTGIKPIGSGTHSYGNEYKKYKINFCKECKYYDIKKIFSCTAVHKTTAPKEYISYRHDTMKGKDCAFFKKKK